MSSNNGKQTIARFFDFSYCFRLGFVKSRSSTCSSVCPLGTPGANTTAFPSSDASLRHARVVNIPKKHIKGTQDFTVQVPVNEVMPDQTFGA